MHAIVIEPTQEMFVRLTSAQYLPFHTTDWWPWWTRLTETEDHAWFIGIATMGVTNIQLPMSHLARPAMFVASDIIAMSSNPKLAEL